MYTIRSLSEMEVQDELKWLASNPTTSATLDTDGVIAEIWTPEVIRIARHQMVCDQFFGWRKDMRGKGDTVHARTRTNMNDGSAMTSTFTEGNTDAINTYEANFSTVDFTGSMKGFGIEITGQSLDETDFDLRKECTEELAYQLALVRDTAIYNVICPTTPSSNEIWGGTATSSIAAGDTFVLNDFVDAIKLLKEDKMRGPYGCLATWKEWGYLAKNSQFTNASEFGNRAVISTGDISLYLGVPITYATNFTARTSSDTDFGVNGHDILICDLTRYAGIATWRPLRLAAHEHPQDDKTYVVGTFYEGYKILEQNAGCVVHLADT